MSEEITTLLERWSRGEPQALEELLPRVYEELRRTAQTYLAREATGHTLQPTAVVHEVYLRLVGWRKVEWRGRAQFFAFAGKLMRRILIDHARGRQTAKRGSGAPLVSLAESLGVSARQDLDFETLVTLDAALKRLEEIDPRQSEMVVLRFFGGLTVEEVAEVLKISRATVKRDWVIAKRWLARELAT